MLSFCPGRRSRITAVLVALLVSATALILGVYTHSAVTAGADDLAGHLLTGSHLGGVDSLIDMISASAVPHDRAFAQIQFPELKPPSKGTVDEPVEGVHEKFDAGFYEKIQTLVGVPGQGISVRTDSDAGEYYDVVIVVATHDAEGNDISEYNKDVVEAKLLDVGAQNIFVAERLSFLTASIPISTINAFSLHGEVYGMGDGLILASTEVDTARVTINATAASLDGADGTGVTVAVIDTGVNHPLLNDKTSHVTCGPGSCSEFSDIQSIHDPDDSNKVSHGTSVAHIIATSGGTAHRGVAQGVDLISIHGDPHLGSSSSVYHALDWAITHGAAVSNISLSFGKCDGVSLRDTQRVILNDAVGKGIFVAKSAGNEGLVNGTAAYHSVTLPGCFENVVAVGGINDRQDPFNMYTSSSRGPVFYNGDLSAPILKPEIVAPASLINVPARVADNNFGQFSGTSFSASMVSAAAAILIGQDGAMNPREVRAALLIGADWQGPVPCTSVQYENNNASDNCSYARQPADSTTANNSTSLGILNNVGFGILDVGQSLQYVTQGRGSHLLSGSLGAGDTRTHKFEVTDTENPVKVLLTWDAPVYLRTSTTFQDRHMDLGFSVRCPRIGEVRADSSYQNNEFAVFRASQAGTCTVTVTGDSDNRHEYTLASTETFVPSPLSAASVTSVTNDWTYGSGVVIDVRVGLSEPATLDASQITRGAYGPDGREFRGLDGVRSVATAAIGSSHYALATGPFSGVQIINITDPSRPTATVHLVGDNRFTFNYTRSVATAEIGDSHYALVASERSHGAQIIEITDPAVPEATAFISSDDNNSELVNAHHVATAEFGGSHYALVTYHGVQLSDTAIHTGSGVQIFNITNPTSPRALSFVTNSSSSDFHFTNPIFTTTAEIGGSHYALTASEADSRIQITDITDPASPQATASIAHLPNGFNIRFVSSITATEIDGSHYAIVTAAGSGVQIINITDPAAPQVAAFMPDIGTIHGGLTAVTTTTEIDGSPHVLVADFDEDTIHIIEIADPTAPRLVVSVKPKEGIFDQMDQPLDVAATVIDGSHYALIASSLSDGIQIIEITVPSMPTNPLLPSVAMDVGPVPRHAAYSGFDGNQTMIFKYMVTDGDYAGDLGYDGSGALDLKSNLLRTAGNDAAASSLPLPKPGADFSLSHNKDIRINTLRVASATYATGNGTLTIEFNVPLNGTVNYDRLHIRDADQGSGGLSLNDVADHSAAGSYVTATLSDAQRTIIDGMTEPQLDMTDGAVSDPSGNPVDGATDLVIRVLPRASPAVQAGDDQTVGEGDTVTLSGAAKDPNGDPITYTWSQTRPSTPNITFANSSRADTTFVAPMVTGDTTFILTLTASDGTDSAEDTLEITVKETGAAFITTWAATDSDRNITLPMTGAYSVLWGDGSHADVSGSQSHMYGTAGNYTVTVLGDGLERIHLYGDTANARQLKSIDQWGDIEWATMNSAFRGASSMVYNATDAPDLSGVTDMSYMFYSASSFNGNLSGWNVSSVTDMNRMFFFTSSFNQTLNDWDVSSVTDMSSMFRSATSFNQPLDSWNVSSVTDMSSMFRFASSFNQTLNDWNVSSVTSMSDMFYSASSFNQALNSWNVSSVNDMTRMFDGADSFEQNLGNWYVVPDSVSIAWTDVPGIVGSISAQNTALDEHNPVYNVTGSDPTRFAIVNGNQLNMTSVGTKSAYTVNVTASEGMVFEDGNNWRILDVTVDTPPVIRLMGLNVITINVGGTYDEPGAVCEDDVDADKAATVGGDRVDITMARTYSVDYSCEDTAGNEATELTRTVVVEALPPLVITILGSNPATITVDTTYIDAGATCKNNVDDSTPTLFDNSHIVTTSIVGNYTVAYTCIASSFVEAYRTVIVTAASDTTNDPPDVMAGGDQTVGEGDFVTLSGTATDHDGDDIAYTWSQTAPASPLIAFANSSAPSTTFVAPPVTGDTVFTIALAADDGVQRVTDTLNITVRETGAAFITTWNTISADQNITINFVGSGMNITWGDGMADTGVSKSQTHTYKEAGNHTVSVTGGLTALTLHQADDGHGNIYALELASIDQWGDTSWTTMSNAFAGASNMVYRATDAPDLSGVTNTSNMFFDAASFNGNLSTWNVSSVTDMNGMFFDAASFNGTISDWNVSSVTLMHNMFDGASDFNGDLSAWNVSSVTDMGNMFDGATAFNQNLGNWYVVPDSVSIAWTDVPGIVGSISAQNTALDEHNPVYNVTGSDPTRFAIVNGNQLNMTSVGTKSAYTVNVTASEGMVFEDGNNWRILDVTVDTPPVIRLMGLNVITITVGGTYDEPGAVCEDDVDADKAATVDDDRVDTTMAGTYSVNYSCEDTAGNDATQVSRTVTVIEPVAPFITTWTATDSDKSITLPMEGTYSILWGDGSNSTNVSDSQSHTYITAGTYTVTVLGDGLESISLYNSSDQSNAPQLKSIEQWGDTKWQSMGAAFQSASNMVYRATDAPDLSDVDYMGHMFFGASTFNANLSSWDVSSVTHMEYMFAETSSFNANLSSWDVSSVTDMNNMFFKASSFNGNLSSWDVSKVTLMYGMFSGASSFNGNLSSWDVSKVTLMNDMFFKASSFNGNLSLWNVSSVTAMNNMFNGASSFNGNLSPWNVSSVNYMDNMFDDADSFDQNLGTWYIVPADINFDAGDASLDITTISTQNRYLRDQIPEYGIGSGDHSNLFDMRGSTLAFNATTVKGSYQANVTASGNDVFENGNNWRALDITVPDSPPTVQAGGDQTVGEGDTVTLSGSAMDPDGDPITYTWLQTDPAAPSIAFANSSAPSTTFTAPAVTGDTTFTLTLTAEGGGQSVEDTLKITVKETSTAFITTWAVSDSDRDITLPMNGTYSILWGDGYQSADVRDPQSHMYGAAGNYTVTVLGEGLENIRLSDDISNAKKLRSIEQWGGTEWTTMSKAFGRAANMAYNATDLPNLSKVNNTSSMFDGASSFNGDLSGWNVSSVTDMSYMFFGASSFDRPLNTWDVSSVTDMSYMFFGASSFDRPLNSWNVSSVIGMDFMFFQASAFNQNLGTWYIVLDDTVIDLADTGNDIGSISAQNSALDVHSPTYGLDTDLFSQKFAISGNDLQVKPGEDYLNETYNIIITATGTNLFGTDNRITVGVRVTDTTPSNRPPSVNAGDDQDAVEGSTVSLNGTATDADLEDTLDYTWTHNSTDLVITFVNNKTVDTTFNAPNVPADTVVEFTLTVDDGTVTVSNSTLVTILDSANSPPDVDAGDDQQLTEGSTVSLNGTVTDADLEDTLGYTWTHNSTDLVITFVNNKTVDTTFNAPNVPADTVVEFTLTVDDGTVTVSNSTLVTILDSANSPPDVDAGDDQQLTEGSTVSLNGTATDADLEDTLDYTWTHNSTDLVITFVNNKTVDTTFNAPNVPADTVVEFTLTVDDGTVTVSNSTLVTILDSANSPPDVDAGDDQQLTEGSTVSLNGTVTDADLEDTLGYTWTHNSTDLVITFVNNKTVDTTFNAPNVPADTVVEFTLTVDDGTVTVSNSTLVTILDSANSPPDVDAGDDQQLTEGSTVSLNGTVTDADLEDTLDYTWTHNSTDLVITFVNNKTVDTTFNAPNVPADTVVEFTLTVDDGTVTVSNSTLVTILDSANSPPDVDAGDDQQLTEGSTVSLNGTVTDADLEDTLDYTWTHNSTDLVITFVNNKTVDTTFNAPNVPADTVVEFTLTVDDGTVTVSNSTLVTILDSANSPPDVDAGDDQQLTEGSTVSLNGTVTDADLEDTLDYTWTHNSTDLVITFVNNKTVDTTFNAPNVPADTVVEFTLTVDDGTVTVSNSTLVTILDSANSPPDVDAGDDQQLTEGSTVSLNGTATDADLEDTLGYTWTHNSTDLVITFVNNKTVDTTFNAPNVPADTVVEFTLTVDDGTVTVSNSTLVTILDSANSPPDVDAGDDQQLTEGSTVSLNGTVTDADLEDTLDYTWTHNSTDLVITFVNNKTVDTTFNAPNVPADTVVEFTLTVDDGTVTVSNSTLVTILDSANSPPDVDAGDDQQLTEGSTVSLNGTVTDADLEDTLGYTWTHNSTDLVITFVNNKTVDTTFNAPNVPADTVVEFTLTVDDGTVTVSNSTLVTILDSANSPPDVDAGDDQQLTEGSTVSLNGTATDADLEDTLGYTWTHNSTDLVITFVNNKTVDTTFNAPNVPADTVVEFTLTVDDGTVTVSNSTLVTILDSANSPPDVDAGDDQQLTEGSTVSLNGTVTDADLEDTLGYTWTHNSTDLVITFVNNKTVDTTFNAPNVPADTVVEFTLTVDDGTVTVSNSTLVTILDSANSPPDVDAGDDQQLTEGSTVSLNGTVTDADLEDTLGYTWTHNSTDLVITFVNNKTVDTTFNAPNVPADTVVEFTLTVDDGTVTVSNSTLVTILDSANSPPDVDAGDDQQLTEGSTVSLNGTATDADLEDTLDYTWTHNSTDLVITFVNNKTVDTTFNAPNVPADTVVEFTLTVDDGTVTVSNSTLVTILDSANSPPDVDAGDDQQLTEGSTVSLNGTVTDADLEDTLGYTWTHNSTDLVITFVNNKTVDTTFNAPNVPADTVVEFTLTVDDGTVTVSNSTLVTILDSANSPPDVDAGDDQQLTEGSTVSLNGTVTDADLEDTLDYTWTHNSTDLVITFVNNKTVDTTFNAPNVPADTVVEFTLTVDDGTVTVSNSTLVTILDSANSPPDVDAGDDQQLTEGSTVSLNGTVTDADLEDTLDYTWTHNSTDLVITFVNNKTVDTTFNAPNVPADTVVEFTLTVDDGTVTVSNSTLVTILDSANSPPDVDAGDDQQLTEGSTVSLNGTVTDADLEDTLDYTWTHNSTDLVITFVNNKTVDTTFNAPNVPADTVVEFTLTVDDGTVTVSNSTLVTILDSANSPPDVDAGDDQQLTEGSTVSLNGTATDADLEDTLDYTWTHNSTDLVITFVNNKTVDTTFNAPNVPADTVVEFTLTVDDGTVTVSNSTLVTILDSANSPPDVDAGDDQQLTEGSTVSLNGTVTDADLEDTLDYTWTHNSTDLVITFVNNKTVDTTFNAPNVPADTVVEFTLTVDDGTVTVSNSTLVTILDSANSPPDVDAGDDQQLTEGSTVSLNGTVTDADLEDTLGYTWTHNSTDLVITFVNNKTVDTTFNAPNVPADTVVEFTLTVDDGTVTVSNSTLVTILDSANSPPDVDAGDDQQLTEGSTVSLNGTATDADLEDTLGYTWTHNSTDLVITFVNNKTVDTTFNAPNVPADTVVEFTLTVDDGTVTVSNSTLVTILDSANSPPDVDAGDDQQLTEGSTVSLNGTVTDADLEDTLDYTWTHNSTDLVITFVNNKTVDTTFNAPNVPADTVVEFTLTVDDGTVTVSNSTLVTILDSANTSTPFARPGDSRYVGEDDAVTLDGSNSYDPDGNNITHEWTQISGSPVTLLGADTAVASFDAPRVPDDERLVFELTVDDGITGDSARITITVLDDRNDPPVLQAIPAQSEDELDTVKFSAEAIDADGNDLRFALTGQVPRGASITRDGVFSWTPDQSQDGLYSFNVTVSDGDGGTDSEPVQVTINDIEPRPVAARSAGSSIVLMLSETITSGTDGPNGFSVNSQNPVAVKSVSGNGTNSLTLLLNGTIQAGSTLSYDQNTGDVADETGKALEPFDGLAISFQSKSRSSAPSPAITIGSQGHPVAPGTTPSGPLQPVPVDGTSVFPLVIDGNGYALHSDTVTVIPTGVTAGRPVTITVAVYDPLPILYFGIYLHLPGDTISHLQSDAQVAYDSGKIRVTDPGGLLRDISMTLSEDPDDPASKTVTLTVTFTESIGDTNMVMRTWNTDRQSTEVRIFDALAVQSPDAADPEPDVVDPEPDAADPEPVAVVPDTADPEPITYSDTAEHQMLVIRMWSGFEPESLTDEQLLHELGLDYLEADIPDWMMTELGVMVAKGDVTVGEFLLALQYVLTHT